MPGRRRPISGTFMIKDPHPPPKPREACVLAKEPAPIDKAVAKEALRAAREVAKRDEDAA